MSFAEEHHERNIEGLMADSEAWALDGPPPLGPQTIDSIRAIIQAKRVAESALHRSQYSLGEAGRRISHLEGEVESARADRDRMRREVESLRDQQRWACITGRSW